MVLIDDLILFLTGKHSERKKDMKAYFSVLAGPQGYSLAEYTVKESFGTVYYTVPAWVKTVGEFDQIIPINSKGDYSGLFERRPAGTAQII